MDKTVSLADVRIAIDAEDALAAHASLRDALDGLAEPDLRRDDDLPDPCPADPLVFGVPLGRHEVEAYDCPFTRTCRACGVQWAGLGECWFCRPDED